MVANRKLPPEAKRICPATNAERTSLFFCDDFVCFRTFRVYDLNGDGKYSTKENWYRIQRIWSTFHEFE